MSSDPNVPTKKSIRTMVSVDMVDFGFQEVAECQVGRGKDFIEVVFWLSQQQDYCESIER